MEPQEEEQEQEAEQEAEQAAEMEEEAETDEEMEEEMEAVSSPPPPPPPLAPSPPPQAPCGWAEALAEDGAVSPTSGNAWGCGACTFLNFAALLSCEMCDAPRPTTADAARILGGDRLLHPLPFRGRRCRIGRRHGARGQRPACRACRRR